MNSRDSNGSAKPAMKQTSSTYLAYLGISSSIHLLMLLRPISSGKRMSRLCGRSQVCVLGCFCAYKSKRKKRFHTLADNYHFLFACLQTSAGTHSATKYHDRNIFYFESAIALGEMVACFNYKCYFLGTRSSLIFLE